MSMTRPTDSLTPDRWQQILADYRYLHTHPEISAHEYATASWLAERMESLGYEVFRIGETGVAAVLKRGEGPVVAFRADTDALPIREETGVEWASTATMTDDEGNTVPMMHACGHDIHMTCALHAAQMVAEREDWNGTAEFIFQPAEENVRGARQMIADGLWETIPPAQVVFGQHVWPIPAGTIQVNPGPFFSANDAYAIDVYGRGGHGSMPEKTIDAIVLAASIIMRLQTIVSREIGLHEKAVLTVGSVHAGSMPNVIAEHARITLTVRSYDEAISQRIHQAIQRIIAGEAAAAGAPEPKLSTIFRTGPIVNDDDETLSIVEKLREVLGEEAVEIPEHPMTASEDFAYLAGALGVPTVFWVFGGYEGMAPTDTVPTNHSPAFLPTPEPSVRLGIDAAVTAMLSHLRTR